MGLRRILVLGITLFLTISIITTHKVESKELESPLYKVVHSESDFEVRFYGESAWITAPVDHFSFEKSTKLGFHRLFQYIEGANLNSSRIKMTVPILTSIVPRAGPLHSSAYSVKLYLPVKFQRTPPLPLPELNLRPEYWSKSRCVAVRKFSGFARDDIVVKEAEKLSVSLSMSQWLNLTSYDDDDGAGAGAYYSIAQYNSPFKFVSRVNEVWVDVSGAEIDGCDESNNLLAVF